MKYLINGSMIVSVSVTVEADSEEQAREMAESWEVPGLCAQCSGFASDQFGDPTDVEYLPFSLDIDGTPEWNEVNPA